MPAVVEFAGLRRTVRDLERLGAEVADLKATMRQAGELVVKDARAGIHSRSGALARSGRPAAAKGRARVRFGSARVRYAGINNYSKTISGGPRLWLNKAGDRDREKVAQIIAGGLRDIARRLDLTT